MKHLKEAFIIVLEHDIQGGFPQQPFISFDKKEIETKCVELNEIMNEKSKNFYSKYKLPIEFIEYYKCYNLEEAIKKFGDDVADYYNSENDQ